MAFIISASTTLAADPPEPKFRHQTIDDKIEIGYGVAAADVDGDTKIDILVADKRQFVWYRNPTWEKFVIAENLTKRDNVCLAAQDLDGDGKCELAVGGDWAPNDRENSGAVFYMIPPEDRTQKWEPVRLHAEPTVHRMRWVILKDSQWALVVAPLHGRGGGDVPSKLLAYHIPFNPRGKWRIEELDRSLHATHNFDVRRGDDGAIIYIAGREGVLEVAQTDTGWTKRRLTTCGAGEVRWDWTTREPDAQTLLATIEPMHGNAGVIHLPQAQDGFRRLVLTDRMKEGHAVRVGDRVDGGLGQIVFGWRGGGGGVTLFTPLDDSGSRWRESVIDDKGMACEDLWLADLDRDRDLDIIASGRATRNVKIYWNETPK